MKKAPDPLHGVTLQRILEELVEHVGWDAMADRVPIRCFESDPSVKSSLTFLRKTPWAREKVERMYVAMVRARARRAAQSPPPSAPSAAPAGEPDAA
jgi:uncharacterized protein (DUF2132 family)